MDITLPYFNGFTDDQIRKTMTLPIILSLQDDEMDTVMHLTWEEMTLSLNHSSNYFGCKISAFLRRTYQFTDNYQLDEFHCHVMVFIK